MGAFKDKIIKELIDNEQYDLADVISDIETDIEAANYLSANRGYYTKLYTTPDLEVMPEFRKALYSDLKTGIVDLDKEFGKDWYQNYENIPSDQIKFVADKQGVSYGELVHRMGKEATEKRRYDIAHDRTIPGYITEFVAPRSVEAIERGESPSLKDATLDVVQNAAYAAPWANISAPVVRLGLGGKIAQGVIGNAATPAIMESADAIAYDDPNVARSDFNAGDVVTESMINASTPWILRGLLRGTGRLTTGKGSDLINKWEQFGTQRATRDDMGKLLSEDLDKEVRKSVKKEITDELGKSASIRDRAASTAYNKAEQDMREQILTKLDLYYNKKVPGYELNLTPEELALMHRDPQLSNYLDIDKGFVNMPSNDRIRQEEQIKNYLTNQFGGQWYEEPNAQSVWSRIPLAGPMIDKYLKEQAEEEEEKAVKDSLINAIIKKYGEPRGL